MGAINTQLLDAGVCRMESQRPHRLQVRAIDLESTDPRIEVADFLQIPIKKYHVIVCSMVINCIPTPSQRGLCLARLSLMATHAVCLTLPRTCLELSPHMTHDHWNNLLRTVGFEVKETNLTPKIALYWLKPTTVTFAGKELNALPNLNQGRKYRHVFGVTLGKDAMTLLRSDRSKVDEPWERNYIHSILQPCCIPSYVTILTGYQSSSFSWGQAKRVCRLPPIYSHTFINGQIYSRYEKIFKMIIAWYKVFQTDSEYCPICTVGICFCTSRKGATFNDKLWPIHSNL